jgi:hypothetical protein
MRYMGNRRADYRPNDEFYTPADIFIKLDVGFDLDVAAPKGGVSWIPADHYYDKAIDGLSQKWYGNIWMNPPFSQSKAWVARFIEHRNGIALLPASKARWFQELWREDVAMTLLPYDLKFVYEHQTTNGIFMPCFLVAFGKANKEALEKVGHVR